ncbi:MAG: hypothetical protein UHM08_03135 [Bacteroidales bacterium]|nr:hypothetical protein [Bacteroidales bacterium]
MAQLKKEWRATADEAKRADLGGQIEEINQQLKEMDASVGNFQRNVGNYVSHWEGMPEVTKDFGAAMREMNEQIEPTKAKFESVSQIASGLASGFAAVQGAAALFGLENENLEKTLVKVQAAMALAQGIGGLSGLVEGLGKAKVAFQGMITSIKAVTAAMSATGWLAVIVAVSAALVGLVSWIKKSKEESDKLAVSLEEQKEASDKLRDSYIDVVGEYRLFQREYSKLDTNEEKINWINENASAFEKMGLNIKNVNEADEAFIRQSTAVIGALKARARAEAATDLYKKKFGEIEAQKDAYVTPVPASSVQGSVTDAGKGKFPAELKGYEDYYYVADGYYQGGTVAYMRKKGVTDADLRNSPAGQARKEQDFAALDAQLAYYEELLGTEEEAALKAEKALADLFKKGNTGGNNGPKILTKEEALALAQAEIDRVTEEDLAKLDDTIIIDDSTKNPTGYTYQDGDAQKRYGFWNGIIDSETSQAVRRNALDGGTQEEQDALVLKGEERKLAKMKEFWEMARQEGDVTGELEFRQMIADQELTIEEKKNEAILKSEEKAKEKRLKIMNEISNALSAAGSITEGILQITQAAAEKDDKITEKEAKRIKGMQYATASINMLQGAITAFSSAMQLGPILGPIVGGVNAAAVVAMGTANLMKIKNTDLTGDVSSGAMGAVTPNSNVFGTDIPFSYTRNVTGQSEVDTLNEPIKVYVTESDITDAVNKSKVRVEEASF